MPLKGSRESEEESKGSQLAELLGSRLLEALLKYGELELENAEIEADELEIVLQPMIQRVLAPAVERVERRIEELLVAKFEEPKLEFPGRIVEVRIGATRAEGGTRDRQLTIGGETLPPFFYLTGVEPMPHPPVVAADVFDMRIPLPKAIRAHFDDVMEDPAEWAKRWVKKYGADMINLHLISTDPTMKDTPPSEAAKVVEEVLQAVKVPLCVGGSGNPEKDVKVFKKVADVAEGERVIINSINLDMNVDDIASYLQKKDCVVIGFSPMDLNIAREVNRKLFAYIERERIINDLNIAGIGYGLEYGFTAAERARLAGLGGDAELQQPLAEGVSNAWASREAWIKMDPYWGPKEVRGPAWETLTGVIALLAGADYFFVAHPTTLQTLKELIGYLLKEGPVPQREVYEWLEARI